MTDVKLTREQILEFQCGAGDMSARHTTINEFQTLCSMALSSLELEWQDISTAPRDGTAILAYDPKWQSAHVVAWSKNYSEWKGGANRCRPTHWLPLPPPPAGSKL